MKVMVAVENDQYAKMAFIALEQRTWPAGTEFFLVHVIESDSYNFNGTLESLKHQITLNAEEERQYQKQHDWLCDLVSKNQAILGDVRFVIITGDATYCLKQLSTLLKPAYLVMTSHERSLKQRLWLKSICASVVDQLECSMEVIKPSKYQEKIADGGQFDLNPKKILVALDGSENSVDALDWLIDQEPSCDICVKLIMVIEDNRSSDISQSNNLHSVYASKRWSTKYNFRQHAREWFDETLAIAKIHLKNNHVEGICVEGDALTKIMNQADEWEADLILLGSHGERGLGVDGIKKSTGSTTSALIENAHQNIIVINSNADVLPHFKWNENPNYSLASELGKVSK